MAGQAVDVTANGVIASQAGVGILLVVKATAPTGVGYAPGCLWLDTTIPSLNINGGASQTIAPTWQAYAPA